MGQYVSFQVDANIRKDLYVVNECQRKVAMDVRIHHQNQIGVNKDWFLLTVRSCNLNGARQNSLVDALLESGAATQAGAATYDQMRRIDVPRTPLVPLEVAPVVDHNQNVLSWRVCRTSRGTVMAENLEMHQRNVVFLVVQWAALRPPDDPVVTVGDDAPKEHLDQTAECEAILEIRSDPDRIDFVAVADRSTEHCLLLHCTMNMTE